MRVLVIVGLLVCLWAPPAAADERAACQAAVDAMVASWPKGRVTAPVICVPTTEISDYAGLYDRGKAKVGYLDFPLDAALYRTVAAHELGHAWEDEHFQSRKQRRYMRLRGITGTWNDAIEDYAEVFAVAMGENPSPLYLVAPIPPGLIETLRAKHLLPK